MEQTVDVCENVTVYIGLESIIGPGRGMFEYSRLWFYGVRWFVLY